MSDKPFAENFVFCDLFEQGKIFGISAQAEFEQVLCLRVFFIDAKIRDDISAFVVLISAVFVFGKFCDHASIDKLGIRVIIFFVGGVPSSVFKRFWLCLQFFCVPTDAVSESEIVIFHIPYEANGCMDAVHGDLFVCPVFVLNGRNGNGHFDELFFPYCKVGIIANDACLPRVYFQVPFVDLFEDGFGDRSDVFFCHGVYLISISFPNSSSILQSASTSNAVGS